MQWRYKELDYPYTPTLREALAALKKFGDKPAKGTAEELQWMNTALVFWKMEQQKAAAKAAAPEPSVERVPVWSIGKIVLIGGAIVGIAWMLKREERKAAARAITEELRGI